MKRLKRILKRALYYVMHGYAIGSLPLVFLGAVSSIYYLLISNIPFLKQTFPHLTTFLVPCIIILPILSGIVGFLFIKKLWFFRVARRIEVEANPYTTKIIPPISIAMWEMWVKLAKLHNIDTTEIEEIIANSKRAGARH